MNVLTRTHGASARTLEIMRCIAVGPKEFTLTHIAQRCGLPASTTHRLLVPWVHLDLLERSGPKAYRVGPELFRLASLIAQKFEIQHLARPLLHALWKDWQETCVLCLFHPSTLSATVVQSIASPQPLKYELPVHAVIPLAWGSLGPAMLAHLVPEDINVVLAKEQRGPLSKTSLPPRKSVLKDLAVIRARRYALYHNRAVDVAGVSAPVLRGDGRVVGSIGVIMPASRFNTRAQLRLPAALVRSATQLSTALIS